MNAMQIIRSKTFKIYKNKFKINLNLILHGIALLSVVLCIFGNNLYILYESHRMILSTIIVILSTPMCMCNNAGG